MDSPILSRGRIWPPTTIPPYDPQTGQEVNSHSGCFQRPCSGTTTVPHEYPKTVSSLLSRLSPLSLSVSSFQSLLSLLTSLLDAIISWTHHSHKRTGCCVSIRDKANHAPMSLSISAYRHQYPHSTSGIGEGSGRPSAISHSIRRTSSCNWVGIQMSGPGCSARRQS